MIHHFPTPSEIAAIVRVAGAKRAAVEDFLDGVDVSMPLQFHLRNLVTDAQEFQWKESTVRAIEAGIRLMYSAKVR